MKKTECNFGDRLHEESKLTYLYDDVGTSNPRRRKAFFLCECGNLVSKRVDRVSLGREVSCPECSRNKLKKHGMSDTKAYTVWSNMLARCLREHHPQFHNYGGRGISVCDRWLPENNGMENFYSDMGEPEDGLSLDRIDVNGNYSPDNCRWATYEVQVENRRELKRKSRNVNVVTINRESGGDVELLVHKGNQTQKFLVEEDFSIEVMFDNEQDGFSVGHTGTRKVIDEKTHN